MSLIVASRFATFDNAETAIDRLRSHGFADEDLSLLYVNYDAQQARFPVGGGGFDDRQSRWASPGAGAGAAVGAIVGLLFATVFSLFAPRSVLVLAVAAGVGAYIGALLGALGQTCGGARTRQHDIRHDPDGTPKPHVSNVLVAVHVSPETQQQVAHVLRQAGGMEVEQHGYQSVDAFGEYIGMDGVRCFGKALGPVQSE
ncbi:hypothetical protein [Paraburkholderia pallida]|uniref:Glycine zipper family protein n=1 Tax=Paraburkholderia pallida TaxID=2547399 RepID=A0A4P7CUY2_9BURK|nr:hypothetical protein [Paraburkholderia pallida]QBQ99097.1 hypothetical protein E1956_17895 [Paraburkholderia pallida]